jgi:hypothetical protein
VRSPAGPLVWTAVAIVGCLLFWVALFHSIAWLSGWRALARAWPSRGLGGSGPSWRFRSAQMRYATNYNGCLTFASTPYALRISTFRIFPGHPPIEVPWDAIAAHAAQIPLLPFWRQPFVVLGFKGVPGVPMRIAPRLAEQLAEASGQQLAIAPEA